MNDSKATNVAAALRALASFPGRAEARHPGRPRQGRAVPATGGGLRAGRSCVVIGEAAEEIAAALEAAGVPFERSGDLPAAVAWQPRRARGDVVLLSPACASFDQFLNSSSAEEFGKLVQKLTGEGPAGRTARAATAGSRHARSRRLRSRDGLQRHLGLGRARRRRPDRFLVKQGAYALVGLRSSCSLRVSTTTGSARSLRCSCSARCSSALRCSSWRLPLTARGAGSCSARSACSRPSSRRSPCACGRARCSPAGRHRDRWASC